MILDERNEFADGVALSGAAGTQQAGDVIDLGTARDIGNGQPLYLYILIESAPTGADTVDFHLVSDAVDPPATDGTATLHFATGATAIADLPQGKMFMAALPIEGNEYERYLAIHVTNAGASSLADLEISAGLTLDPKGWKAYPEGAN